MFVTILVILGVILIILGVIIILRPPKPEPEPEPIVAEGIPDELTKLVEQVGKLLDRFEKRYVPGVFLMLVGLALIGFGAWFEAQDAKDAAESASAFMLASPALLRTRTL